MATHIGHGIDYERRTPGDRAAGRYMFNVVTPLLAAVISLILAVLVVLRAAS